MEHSDCVTEALNTQVEKLRVVLLTVVKGTHSILKPDGSIVSGLVCSQLEAPSRNFLHSSGLNLRDANDEPAL